MTGVLRKVPLKGYKHPQYLPTVHRVVRRVTGKRMKKVVLGEIEEIRGPALKAGFDPTWQYLKNFIMHIGEKSFYRTNRIRMENWNSPYRKISVRFPAVGNLPERVERTFPDKTHSTVFLRQTPKEFYETIDRALKETGVNTAEVIRLKSSDNDVDRNKAVQLLLPAYIRLREWGYKKDDLNA